MSIMLRWALPWFFALVLRNHGFGSSIHGLRMFGTIIFVWMAISFGVVAEEGRFEDLTLLESKLRSAVQRARLASVAVTESRETGFGSFSGVIVSAEGDVLSVAHAIKPGNRYLVHLADGRKFRAIGKGMNRRMDCGMLVITEKGDWPFAPMGFSSTLTVDQPLFCISHPGAMKSERGPVIRFGKVLLPISPRLGMIQSSVKMEPGDSGGPLFNLNGEVVGIRSQIQQALDENFDVPVDSYRAYWDQLHKEEEFTIERIPGLPDPGFQVRRSRRGGSRVVSVAEESPAAKAGLREDDLIVNTEGSGRGSISDRIAARYLSGDREIELEILRDDQKKKLIIEFPPSAQPSSPLPNNRLSITPTTDSQIVPVNNDPQVLSDLSKATSELEGMLDDMAVVIRSKKYDQSLEIMGAIVDKSGYVISKSSCVGEGIELRHQHSGWIKAEVVQRHPATDLVLLKGAFQPLSVIPLVQGVASPDFNDLGCLLISPRVDDRGWVSVLASRTFTSPRNEGRGYLGVVLGSKDSKVVIEEIRDGGAAKKSGLLVGDIVLRLDDHDIQRPEEMHAYLRTTVPNDRVEIEIERNGERKVEKIVLGEVIQGVRHVAEAFDGGKSHRRDGFDSVFVHDAPLYPHEIGGPLFDLQGRFVGLNIARYSRTQSYAIPASTVHKFIQETLSK